MRDPKAWAPHDDYKQIDPEDIGMVLLSQGYTRTTVQPDHEIYQRESDWGTMLVCTDKSRPDFTQHTARVVEKILEKLGPQAVYDLWGRVERKKELARLERQGQNIFDMIY